MSLPDGFLGNPICCLHWTATKIKENFAFAFAFARCECTLTLSMSLNLCDLKCVYWLWWCIYLKDKKGDWYIRYSESVPGRVVVLRCSVKDESDEWNSTETEILFTSFYKEVDNGSFSKK